MRKTALRTPTMILDLDILEKNLARYHGLAAKHNKLVWPMAKTHKSTEIARMQHKAGATGFLGGTLDECEAFCRAGLNNIMYAYPVAHPSNIARLAALAKSCDFFTRLDCADVAPELNAAAEAAECKFNYTIIVDTGLHRFGVAPEEAVRLAIDLKPLKNLIFKGISTHPGHVYGSASTDEVAAGSRAAAQELSRAKKLLAEAGFICEMVTCGSTPSYIYDVENPDITILHPGNYVFHDMLSVFFGAAGIDDCSLRVMATVVSRHPGYTLIDAGSKCVGLDKGGHGISSVRGYGHIVGHDDLELVSVSEEVGKIVPDGLTVGQHIEIIPNHTCTAANLTSYLIGCRGDEVERLIKVDLRGNSTTCGV